MSWGSSIPRADGEAGLTIKFRLLGPMELHTDDRAAKLPGPAERTLLALLLLSPGRVVPTTTLVDRLWNDAALPDNPLNALQLRVSKLRRALAELGLGVVHRDASGYLLDVDRASVDVHLFAQHIREARAEVARAGMPSPTAIARYDAALQLWRAEPFVDFAGELWAAVEAARLVQLRLAALTERAELALALGRHAQVAAGLAPVVRENPQQEALAALLMTALYQGGRQAEAVEVFLRTQTVLDDELGLEPSAQLRLLHQRILRQDPQLDPSPLAVSAQARHSGVPAPAVGLIGRDREVAAVSRLLGTNRLVTLVGPGGAGKTALAMTVARNLEVDFEHGVSVARLAAEAHANDVALAVAQGVGVPLDGTDPTVQARDRLIAYLRNRRMLLVLDNCEHVIDAIARLADDLMAAAPGLALLATSREALAVPGELQYAVGPLVVPPEGTGPHEIGAYAAAQLLLERVRAMRADLAPGDGDLLAVGQICRQLDGMPLALELAAARAGSLGLPEVAGRLADRFGLLTVGPRTAEDRHRTLRKTVDWSHALLTDGEQLAFRRLAVFHGGWTLTAAEAVLDRGGLRPADVSDLLAGLVARSMIISEPGEPTRFRMLETLRHYALQRLDEAGEMEPTSARHARYFLSLAEQADRDLRGPGQRAALRRLRQEDANIKAALAYFSAAPAHADDALQLGGALGLYWHLGRHVEGREVLRALLRETPAAGPAARARALQAVSLVERPRGCLVHPSPRCAATAAESLDLFLAVGAEDGAALSRVLLAVEHLGSDELASFDELLTEAEHRFDSTGDAWGNAVVAFVRLQHFLLRGDRRRARATGRAARDAFRALDDLWGLSAVLYHLGCGLREFGDYAESVAVHEEAVEVAISAGMVNTAQWALGDLGLTLLYLGENDAADGCFARARAVAAELGDAAGEMLAAYGSAVRARLAGDPDRARPLYSRAADGFRRLGTAGYAAHAEAGLAWCDIEQERTESAEERYEHLRGAAGSLHDPGLAAVALEGLARVAASSSHQQTARDLLARAQALRAAAGRPAAPPDQAQLDAILSS